MGNDFATYKISKTAGYHGAGVALAIIKDGAAARLAYLNEEEVLYALANGLISETLAIDDEGPAVYNHDEARDAPLANELKTKGAVVGLCSCWEFLTIPEAPAWYDWHQEWSVELNACEARHRSGLTVRFHAEQDGGWRGEAINIDEWIKLKPSLHVILAARMLREAGEVYKAELDKRQ